MFEPRTFTSRRGAVTLSAETATVDGLGEVVTAYVVTSPSGYRATFRACLFDLCLSGERKPCTTPTGAKGQHAVNGKTSVDAWLEHEREYCHGWHAETAERFARDVLKTYGTRPKSRQLALPGITPYMIQRWAVVDCPAWPVVEDRPLPPGCDCESCRATLAQFGRAAA